ncbi:LANO_0E09164g1_1 [Lachancea nothofagi CBS 11611]|uniref:LANO_0E09164g1_1 n=1 Tax=Lachancea nothofagi CBS 11611 TaxID=1266666 RepID=A0A1G4JVT0_9SACH|nr:LANO_0E09164g1_1 [Lachancea nothofagi CBS 11611]
MAHGLEPRTSAKCTIWTSLGPLKVELWAKECPKTVFRFLKNCVDGEYDGVSFKRKVFDVAVQTADAGNEPWETMEMDTRIKMNCRGLLAVSPGSKGAFFVTLRDATELDGKVTVFGKLVDNSYYTLLRVAEKELKPEPHSTEYLYPATIERIEIEEPYFEKLDANKRPIQQLVAHTPKPKRAKRAAKIRLDYEDEGDAEEAVDVKIAAAHDLSIDESLVRQTTKLSPNPDSEESQKRMEGFETPQEGVVDEPVEQKASSLSSFLQSSGSASGNISERELKTMELLAKFKQKSAHSNPITSHELNFSKKGQ